MSTKGGVKRKAPTKKKKDRDYCRKKKRSKTAIEKQKATRKEQKKTVDEVRASQGRTISEKVLNYRLRKLSKMTLSPLTGPPIMCAPLAILQYIGQFLFAVDNTNMAEIIRGYIIAWPSLSCRDQLVCKNVPVPSIRALWCAEDPTILSDDVANFRGGIAGVGIVPTWPFKSMIPALNKTEYIEKEKALRLHMFKMTYARYARINLHWDGICGIINDDVDRVFGELRSFYQHLPMTHWIYRSSGTCEAITFGHPDPDPDPDPVE